MQHFTHILVIGLGLIGASFAKMIRHHKLATTITGYDIDPTTQKEALAQNIVDQLADYNNLTDLIKTADCIVLATPLNQYEAISKTISKYITQGTIITDMGSVKSSCINSLKKTLTKEQYCYFVPTHPIAGSQQQGVHAAHTNLFTAHNIIITPHSHINSQALLTIRNMWQSCGCYVKELDPQEHDGIYARVSHFPQLLAYSFITLTKHHPTALHAIIKNHHLSLFIRIAHSPINIWSNIFQENQLHLTKIIHETNHLIKKLITSLHNNPSALLEEIETMKHTLQTKFSTTICQKACIPSDHYNPAMQTLIFIMPIVFAYIAAHIAEKFLDFSGNGLKDFLSPLLSSQNTPLVIEEKHIKHIMNYLAQLTEQLNLYKTALKQKNIVNHLPSIEVA